MNLSTSVPDCVPYRVPPHVYFVAGAIFHYLGPACAVLVFVDVEPTGVAWLRIASAAAIFSLWRRPWRAWPRLDRQSRRTLVCWGGILAAMNTCFYAAIASLPLKTVAAIEFLPVVALAALGAHTLRNAAALVLAVGGVYLLTDVHLASEPIGLLFAAGNAVLFAAYIVLGHEISRNRTLTSIDGLALAMLVAGAVALPFGLGPALPAFTDPTLLAASIGVGVCSSVIPYVTDQLAMRRLARAHYSLMISLLPATATVVGAFVLAQIPTWVEVLGVLLVAAGVALHQGRVRGRGPRDPDQREHGRDPASVGSLPRGQRHRRLEHSTAGRPG